MSDMTEDDWAMSLKVVEELRANPKADRRVIIADWLRKARDAAVSPQMSVGEPK